MRHFLVGLPPVAFPAFLLTPINSLPPPDMRSTRGDRAEHRQVCVLHHGTFGRQHGRVDQRAAHPHREPNHDLRSHQHQPRIARAARSAAHELRLDASAEACLRPTAPVPRPRGAGGGYGDGLKGMGCPVLIFTSVFPYKLNKSHKYYCKRHSYLFIKSSFFVSD